MLERWICCDFLTNRWYKSFWYQLAADTSWRSALQNWVKKSLFLRHYVADHESQCGRWQYVVHLSHAEWLLCLAGMPDSAIAAVPFTAGSVFIIWRIADCFWRFSCIYLLCKLQIAHRKLTLFQVFRLHVSRVWVMNFLLFALAFCVVV